jgi:diguanylate cyclase (GGDEF)-like protein
MNFSQLLFGEIGYVYSYSSTILILSLMFIISLRLFMSRRKKAYFSLTISLAIIIAQYILLIVYTVSDQTDLQSTEYLAQLLQVLAFILINMGIFQLYNASTSREYTFFLVFVAIGMIIGSLRYYLVMSHPSPSLAYLLFQNIWIEIYLLVLTFLAFYMVSPNVGQRLKYQIALTIYFVTQLTRIINHYIISEPKSSLMLVENFAPILFYIIIFIIIFDRVVELLQAIYDSSIKDSLTTLYNRHYFFNRVAEYINRGERVSVIFCDIDNFKKLNDTRGHQMGDLILKQVSKIMMEESENIGIACRYGGEELVILLTDTSLRVENIAEKIRRRVESETKVTISIGYSKYRKSVSPQQLIEQADMAMYQSKKTGKNKITAYPAQ